MSTLRFFFTLALILIFFHLTLMDRAFAQAVSDSSYSSSTTLLPAVGSTPETGLILGGLGLSQFRIGHPETGTRPSSLMISAIYTAKNQLSIGAAPFLIFEGESWLAAGEYSYVYFPELFWGVGMDAEQEMNMISRQLSFNQRVLKKISSNFFAGIEVRWNRNFDVRFESIDGEPVASPDIIGAFGYSSLGVGMMVQHDTRNSILYPIQGHSFQFSSTLYPAAFGTLEHYTVWLADLRTFKDLRQNGRSILALRFITQVSTGIPPLQKLMLLGGQNLLRGYYQGRLRDLHGAAIQAEWRQVLNQRFGFILFADAGEVWENFNSVRLSSVRWSGGGGIRFNVNKNDRTHIRLDYGIGKGTTGMYITIGEAF